MLKGELEHIMCWQQLAPTALQHESKPQGSQGAEPGVGIAPNASLGNWW